MADVYWQKDLGGPAHRDPLAERVDVAVVGAGFAGLSIALDLQQAAPGLRIAVLDAHRAGYGASGRNAGLVLPLAVLAWLVPRSAHGHERLELLELYHARVGRTVGRLQAQHPDAEIRPVQMLLMATNRLIEAGLGWAGDTIGSAGIPVERWTGDDVTAACSAAARAGMAMDAWTIQPARLARSLASSFVAAGGLLHEGTRVTAVTADGGGARVELGSGQPLHADRVVVCTGAYTGGIALPDRIRARPVHTYMRASRPLPPTIAGALGGEGLFLSAPGLGMPCWRVHEGRLVFNGMDIGGLEPDAAADDRPRGHRGVDRLSRRLLPAAATAAPAYRWGGAMHLTASETPFIALSAASDRIVYAVGFGGSGVALTLTSGPLVRDLVLGASAADPEAVLLRNAISATAIPWRGLLDIVQPAAAHVLRGLVPCR